jgi:hypothetical protein
MGGRLDMKLRLLDLVVCPIDRTPLELRLVCKVWVGAANCLVVTFRKPVQKGGPDSRLSGDGLCELTI